MNMKPPAATDEHRRHAIQIACALPETAEDALIVLELARHLVATFLNVDTSEAAKAPVVTLVQPRGPNLSA
jgi:hypothetical protein